MSPREIEDIVNAHLQRLAEPVTPLSHVALGVQANSKPILAKLKSMNDFDIVDGEFLTEIMGWFKEAGDELRRR